MCAAIAAIMRAARWSPPARGASGQPAPAPVLGESSLTEPFTLAIDAMGGDNAPLIVLDGLAHAAERHPGARFLLIGDEAQLAPLLATRKRVADACTVRHAPSTVSSDMKPTAALRVRDS